jgi:hypothetical protein
MKKKYPHHFYCEIFFQNFYFCNGWKRDEMRSFFGVDIGENDKGVTMSAPDGIIIWIESDKYIGALVHESVHAAKFLFSQKGVQASTENDEPLAYMVQYIFDNCHKKIRKKRV